MGRNFGIKPGIALLLYIWHTLFCIAYYVYSQNAVTDAENYYLSAIYGNHDYKFGGNSVLLITTFIVDVFGLDYLALFFVFNIFGAIGYLAFYGSVYSLVKYWRRVPRLLALSLLFLPSISFWSAALGKDAISFLSVGLILWASLKFNQRKLYALVAILLMSAVRPHVALVMLGAIMISVFIENKSMVLRKKIVVLAFLAATLSVLLPLAVTNMGVGEILRGSDYIDVIEDTQAYYADTDSGASLQSLPFYMKVFSNLYRPLIFEAGSIFGYVVGTENFILLLLTIYALLWLPSAYQNIKTSGNAVFLIVYPMTLLVFFSITSLNMGLASRQKWMYMPMLIYLLYLCLHKKMTRKGVDR